MRGGYVGRVSIKKRRYRYFFLFLILFIGAIIYFAFRANEKDYQDDNSQVSMKEKTETLFTQENYSITINKLENKIFEKEQKILLRDNLINSLKKKIENLENSNDELIAFIKLDKQNAENNFEFNQKNILEIKKLKITIDNLNQDIDKINDDYLAIKKEKNLIANQIKILNNNNTILITANEKFLKQIDNLKKTINEKNISIKEKNKSIKEKNKSIKKLKDIIQHP